jgi:magnesium-transporting ATPase (P-type)
MQHRLGRFENEDDRKELEGHLVFAATFWLNDPLRENVGQVIADLHRVGTDTKILSGDHEATVSKTVEKLGMFDNSGQKNTVSATEFRKFMEPIFNKENREFKGVEAVKLFTENIKEKVHSMYRCTPEDKLMFV